MLCLQKNSLYYADIIQESDKVSRCCTRNEVLPTPICKPRMYAYLHQSYCNSVTKKHLDSRRCDWGKVKRAELSFQWQMYCQVTPLLQFTSHYRCNAHKLCALCLQALKSDSLKSAFCRTFSHAENFFFNLFQLTHTYCFLQQNKRLDTLAKGMSLMSSSVFPLFEKHTRISSGERIPMSPCSASTGLRKTAFVPVDTSV